MLTQVIVPKILNKAEKPRAGTILLFNQTPNIDEAPKATKNRAFTGI